MNANDIYKSKVISQGNFWEIEEHLHPELLGANIDYGIFPQDKIDVRCHFFHNVDGRRYYKLSSIWFEKFPVMIVQNAGREGTDHEARFITNLDLYNRMIEFIRSFDTREVYDIYNVNDEIPELTNFYGVSIDDEIK